MTVDTSEFTPEISEYIDEAYARCGVEYRTAYQLKSAIRSLNFILADWANRGLNRWTIEQKTLTLTANDRISRSEYLNIPNKLQTGKPNQFYLDRDTNPVLYLWPTPDDKETYKIVYDEMKRIGHIDHTNESPDIPFRFYQCLASGLAYQLSLKFAPDRVGLLKQEYEEDFKRAADEDRDRSGLKLISNGAYSRV
jgi:hypothetical protein